MRRPSAVDHAEIESLYRAFGAMVRRRARSILGSDVEAEDALQEVFVRVVGSIADFRRQSQPSTWLYRITTNLCLNRVRNARRRWALLETMFDLEATVAAAPSGEMRATLRKVLGNLPPDLGEIAVYYYVDEMDHAEIAQLLGVSRRTIGYRLERFQEHAQRLVGEGGLAAAGEVGVPEVEEGSVKFRPLVEASIRGRGATGRAGHPAWVDTSSSRPSSAAKS